jgi:hypothetical protein
MRKPLSIAGTEQNDFRPQTEQRFKVLGAQRIEARGAPGGDRLVWRKDQTAVVPNLVDFDEAGTVGGDGVQRCQRIRVKLQFNSGSCRRRAASHVLRSSSSIRFRVNYAQWR